MLQRKYKAWKKCIFAAVVAACAVLPAAPVAASGSPDIGGYSPAEMVTEVYKGHSNPSSMEKKTEELPGYQANMAQVKEVVYETDKKTSKGTISVIADVSKMTAYLENLSGGYEGIKTQKLYTLVMKFDSKYGKDNIIGRIGDADQLINEKDRDDGYKFLPEEKGKDNSSENAIVFWLNAKTADTDFTLYKTEGNSGSKQDMTVEIFQTGNGVVKDVFKAASDVPHMKEDKNYADYQKNMDAVKKVDFHNSVLDVYVNEDEMVSYTSTGNLTGGSRKYFALVMSFASGKENIKAQKDSTKGAGIYGYGIEAADKTDSEKFLPADRTGKGENEIVFWLDTTYKTLRFWLTDSKTNQAELVTINIKEYPSITDVTLDQSNLDLTVGETSKLSATVKSDSSSPYNLKWTTSDEKVATVSQDGTVEAKGAGTATIRAIAEISSDVSNSSLSAACTVTVKNPTVTGVTLDPGELDLTVGETSKLTPAVTTDPESVAKDVTMTWKSSDEQVAAVSEDGTVEAKGAGEATVTVTAKIGESEATASCTVTVKEAPSEQQPEQQQPEQKPEQQQPEQQKPEQQQPEQQKPEQQKPEQQKPEQQKPEQQKPEQQQPEQKPSEQKATVKLNATRLTMKKDSSTSALEVAKASVKGDKIKSVKSSNSKVVAASVKKGETITLKAKKKGTATITVTMKSGAKAKVTVTVTNSNKKIVTKKITLDAKKVTLKVKKKVTLDVTRNPINATEKISWSTSNPKVATVKNGVVTAKKAGKATITAKTSNGKKASCTVTVKK